MESNNNTPTMGKGNFAPVQSEEALISSPIDLINSQVESAVSFLIKDYEGLEIQSSALHGLTAQIKQIVSQVLSGFVREDAGKKTAPTSSAGNTPKGQELKGVLRVNLPLSTTRNSNTVSSEVELVQMALRKLQYDHTRKMVNMVDEDCLEQAARVANELTVADAVMGKLFHAMSNAVDRMNNAIMGLGDRAKDVVYAGFEDNINRVFQEHYIEYHDDAARPGV